MLKFTEKTRSLLNAVIKSVDNDLDAAEAQIEAQYQRTLGEAFYDHDMDRVRRLSSEWSKLKEQILNRRANLERARGCVNGNRELDSYLYSIWRAEKPISLKDNGDE